MSHRQRKLIQSQMHAPNALRWPDKWLWIMIYTRRNNSRPRLDRLWGAPWLILRIIADPLSFEDNAQSGWNSRIIHDALNNAWWIRRLFRYEWQSIRGLLLRIVQFAAIVILARVDICNFVAEINDNLCEIRNFTYGKLFWIILWVVEKPIFELL